jgi:hypothetical protein
LVDVVLHFWQYRKTHSAALPEAWEAFLLDLVKLPLFPPDGERRRCVEEFESLPAGLGHPSPDTPAPAPAPLTVPSAAPALLTSEPPRPPPIPQRKPPARQRRLAAALKKSILEICRSPGATIPINPLDVMDLDRIAFDDRRSPVAARCTVEGLQLCSRHPVVREALARFDREPFTLALLVSTVFTALNLWSERISDAHETQFQGLLAERIPKLLKDGRTQ